MYASIEQNLLSKMLSQAFSRPVEAGELRPVGGGSISSTYKLQSSEGNVFLKVNRGKNATEMFDAEANGLATIREKSSFVIPRVIGSYNEKGTAYLFMDFIETSNRSSNYWDELAINLAGLHRHSHSKFGFKGNNFIGSLPQQNDYADDWPSFFGNQRIRPMVKMAFDKNLISKSFVLIIESALKNITALMPEEPPALVHGDLWSGNLMIDPNGAPCLVDPAIYYGHREMDIAFSHLFGGFSQRFYQAYAEGYPMQPGFDNRIDLYNLYPLLVHLNLFGRSYLSQIEGIIARFT